MGGRNWGYCEEFILGVMLEEWGKVAFGTF